MMARALIVFGDASGLWWLRWLRPGFRHCFVVVASGDGWVVVDPASHGIAIAAVPAMSLGELAAWYQENNLVVVECEIMARQERKFPAFPLTCVEVVKRIVGIRAFFVWTPWQLFRHATENRKKSIDTLVPMAYIQR